MDVADFNPRRMRIDRHRPVVTILTEAERREVYIKVEYEKALRMGRRDYRRTLLFDPIYYGESSAGSSTQSHRCVCKVAYVSNRFAFTIMVATVVLF